MSTPRVVDCEVPFKLPVNVTLTDDVTAAVATTNVALEDPEGITMFAGTEATPLLEASATDIPPEGAGPVKVAIPVADVPPTTFVGETEMEASVATVIVNVALAAEDGVEADINAEVALATGEVVTVNVAVVLPAATVTVPGTVAA